MEEITIKIKSTSQTFDINIAANSTISNVKDVILGKMENVAKEQLCLIFSGKILKDLETLDACKITNEMAIHLVVRQGGSRPAPSAATTSTPASTTPQPEPQNNENAAPGFGNMFGAMPRMPANPAAMMQQMQQNPDMMRQMMDSPIVQSLMSNPDIMRSMMANNPQIQELIQRNPEVGHILNDPDIMRQTMEMMRNPNMFNEMMRNHDLAIRNLQGIPGGEAALQRLYTDVQEPLLNSASSTFGGNPYASSGNEDSSSRSQRAGVENRDALPNPWDSGSANRQSTGGVAAAGNEEIGGAGRSPFAGLLGGAGLDDMIHQLTQQNPQLFNSFFQNHPMVQANPQMAEMMRTQLPNMINMFSRPEFSSALSNPRVIEAFRQIQTGMDTLRREAPELARSLGMPSMPIFPGTGATPTAPTTPAAASPNPSQPQSNLGSASVAPDVAQMMRMMQTAFGNMNMGGGVPPPDANTNFEELYSAQLEQLASMGFTNRAQNIAALRASFGDLNGAVERLLNSP